MLRAKRSDDGSSQIQGRFERRLLFSVLRSGAPGVVLSLLLLWSAGFSLDHKIEITVLVVLLWLGLSFSAQANVVNSLRVLSNVLSAMKDEDFSFLAKDARMDDALGNLALEINSLSRALAEERLGSAERAGLLRKVMAEAGTIIFAVSPDNRVRLVNRSGALFLGRSEEKIVGRTASELGIADLIEGPPSEVVTRAEAGLERRWIVRRATFRQHGEPHRLVVLSEASEALRAEERLAWQRLIRVLSHEINNSLAPIRTIARTLGRMAVALHLPSGQAEDFHHGLEVIHDRADSLGRFLQNYTRVMKIPAPERRTITLHALVSRVASLETRVPVSVLPGPNLQVHVDPDQLEQALINLIKNAAEAVLLSATNSSNPEAVTVLWNRHSKDLELWVRDKGIGLTQTENLFVPFYTTKQTGSGIGLLLSRQIVEAHKGTLLLRNRPDGPGCEVEIKLPACIIEIPSGPREQERSNAAKSCGSGSN
jgi:nitrogen fixation/metabolism regulation signal transduction histidine kinase